jgi:diguanylate cyclase (GGDEF)-like protein
VAQVTKTLGNLAQAEFVVLAVLAIWHWGRSRIRGAGWAAVSFMLLAGIGLAGRGMRYGWIPVDQVLLKVLVGVLLVVPYAFYRFAAAFDRPRLRVRVVAGTLTAAALVATSGLDYFPLKGMPSPPGFTAFRLLVTVQWGFLFTFVAVRMWRAGRDQGETARRRMRLLAAAAAGLNVQVLVGAAGLTVHPWMAMVSSGVTVLMAGAFCLGFAPPAVLRLRWRRTHNEGFQEAMANLVRAASAEDVAGRLLPHVAAYVGAPAAAVLDADGNPIASHGAVPESADGAAGEASVQLRFGDGGSLVVWTSPYVPYFGRDELRLLGELADLIGLAIERCTLVERERDAEKALARQALHDALTGLPNRTLFVDRLQQALAGIERRHTMVAVMFVDLDRFKLINDGMDHSAGDAVLLAVARQLCDTLRAEDTVARFGGDEFVVLTEVPNADEALALANRLRRAVAKPVLVEGRELVVTASVGVVVTRRCVDPASLLRDADAAMYRAKDSGRNRVEVFTEDVRLLAIEKLELERALQQAVPAGDLRVVFQPTIRLSDGRLSGLEALVRWQHPQRGLLSPATFIPIAEESDLIVGLGEWVLEHACRQVAEWKATIPGLGDFVLWVNMSVGQFLRTNPAEVIARVLAETGLPAGALGIEITESVFMTNTDRLGRAVADLQALGVSIAIDDFGSGFSSLGYLKRFPINVIKVDSSFVQGIGGEPETALVRACLALADSLGLATVAEGVETADQAAWLARSGCHQGQGYFYSRPLEPADAEAFLVAESLRVSQDPVSRSSNSQRSTTAMPIVASEIP